MNVLGLVVNAALSQRCVFTCTQVNGWPKKEEKKILAEATCHFYRFPGLRERRAANLWEVMDVSRVAKSYVWEAERQLTQTQCRCGDKKGDKHQKKKKKKVIKK